MKIILKILILLKLFNITMVIRLDSLNSVPWFMCKETEVQYRECCMGVI